MKESDVNEFFQWMRHLTRNMHDLWLLYSRLTHWFTSLSAIIWIIKSTNMHKIVTGYTENNTEHTHSLQTAVHVYILICGHVQFTLCKLTQEHISMHNIIGNTCGSGLICSLVQIQALIYTLRRLDLKHYYQNMHDPTKDDGVWTYLAEKANTHVLELQTHFLLLSTESTSGETRDGNW